MNRLSIVLVTLLVMGLLPACVTESTGGYTNEPSPEKALERRVSLARQYIGEGDWENAKRNLELAEEIDGDSAEVHEAFGLVYQSTGEYERADARFQRALKIDPSLSRARNNYAAFLFSRGRFEEAEAQFERVTVDSLYSGRPLAFVNLGLARLRLNDDEGAEAAFSRALSMDRTNPIALLEMGFLRFAAGDIASADRYYGVYRTVVARQSPRALLLGIDIAEAKGDNDARSSYEMTLRNLYPQSPEYQAYQSKQSQ
ncbi:type IV pilus biogenesis/stability protein PilW [Luminiphilus syltensis NOR5-1B]|uniref:Type IV pilus biogenesis/stability protein PilW n=1 Tax=Luminiphilus syltensis NOR5-1B TaxID=565045 RepID=B8KXH3_9GAMM|nr:type IV pilus biogenesis/stability protein PilW [Luminiphilus syltensis]EED36724.1 type IV pilus biogenesis/stability protein PilW [Luminiphilus syltensis NOR5-1B]